ncbi:MAG: hypothetical protein H6839_04265 [Planctomycetes bacterium]|nr:hypothetical protein [Planctomycetota bacterium]
MTSNHEAEGYDNTPEGRELVALLKRHAPPAVNARAGAEAVMKRIGKPRGRLLRVGTWLPPLVGAAAAVALAFVIFSPKPDVQPTTPPEVAANKVAPAPTQAEIRHDRSFPEIVALVRGNSGDGVLIDAGLKDGLRVGDMLLGSGGVKARVTALGVFDARVAVTGGVPVKGAELRTPVTTEAQSRAAKYADFGGDPGAFLEFGVLLSAMPLSEARMLGISDGAAMRVDETIPALLRDPASAPQATLAAQLDLRAGDVLVEVNGAHIGSSNDLGNALGWSLDPKLLTVRILRNGRQLDLKLR